MQVVERSHHRDGEIHPNGRAPDTRARYRFVTVARNAFQDGVGNASGPADGRLESRTATDGAKRLASRHSPLPLLKVDRTQPGDIYSSLMASLISEADRVLDNALAIRSVNATL